MKRQSTVIKCADAIPSYRHDKSRTTARSGANHLLSDGNFRRSTSKKSKIKLTLLFGLGWLSVPGAFSTAKRLPSGCTSKLGKTPRSVNWPGDQGRGLSAWKESPEAL